MGHLVEADVAEEGVEVDVVELVFVDEQVGNGLQDSLELGLHGVLELQTAGAFFFVDALVVGQVDGDGFGTCIAVAGIVDDVIHVQVALGTGHGGFVFRVAGQVVLQLGQHLDELGKVVAPFLVLHKDERLVAGLATVECIVVVFNGSHDKVEFALLHVHPGQVAGIVVVGHEGFAALGEVFLQSGILGQVDGHAHEAVHFGQAVGIFHMIGHHFE